MCYYSSLLNLRQYLISLSSQTRLLYEAQRIELLDEAFDYLQITEANFAANSILKDSVKLSFGGDAASDILTKYDNGGYTKNIQVNNVENKKILATCVFDCFFDLKNRRYFYEFELVEFKVVHASICEIGSHILVGLSDLKDFLV